jgi:hypothetical protein
MAVVETWVSCELTEPVKVHYLKGNVFSQDSAGNLIGVEVFKNGAPASLSGSVNGYCVLADGSTVPVSGARVGNKVSVTLLQACYAIPGPISIVVKLTDGNTITTLGCIVGTVYLSKTDNMVAPSQTVITDWSQQIAEVLQQCIDATVGTVKYSENQSLTDTQKAVARFNIDAASPSDIPSDTVKYGSAQSLTDAQKAQARTNIGAAGGGDIPTGAVLYDSAQSLTDEQKAQARSNINAASPSDIPSDTVKYGSAQSLTDAQKSQARSNIDANVGVGLYVGNDGYIYQEYTV